MVRERSVENTEIPGADVIEREGVDRPITQTDAYTDSQTVSRPYTHILEGDNEDRTGR